MIVRPQYGIVAIASSAGGLKALTAILAGLPADFAVPVIVVQHLDRSHRSMMAEILDRRTALRVKQAEDAEKVEAGWVYVAPPDHHLLINPDRTLSLSNTGLVHYVRPSADVMFESVASSYGRRAIAVVATGTGSDGADGVSAIKKAGGIVMVQNESSSDFFGMPGAAIQTGNADLILPLDELAAALLALVRPKAEP